MIIGLDVGGTHVDAVVIQNKRIIKSVKREVDSNNLFNSIWGTIKELILNIDKTEITKVNLRTTISTNAIVEGKTSKVGLIIQSGPELPNEYYEIGDRNIFLSGYTDHRGTIVKDYLETEIKNGVEEFNKVGIKHVGIITKFSTRNSRTEQEIKKSIKSKFTNITLGHEVSGRLNFPRRINTVYLNESVYDAFKNFTNNITLSFKKEGINVPISILKADGGIMSLDSASKKPVESILSGPSASLMGITSLIESKEDAILLDIGGTTTDIFFLADGVPLFEPQGIKIDDYKTLVRSELIPKSWREGIIKIPDLKLKGSFVY